MYQHHQHHQMSRKTPAEHLHQLHRNEPRKVIHLAGLMYNWKTINSCVSLLQRKTRHIHEDVEFVYGKISRKKRDLFARIAVFLSIQKAATRDIKHWNITKGVFKISIFISYSFLVIYFFYKTTH
jgi:hypothetical protein